MPTTLKDPKSILLVTGDGIEKKYLLGKFTSLDGRRIVTHYISTTPRISLYDKNVEVMRMAMKYVAVDFGDTTQILETDLLIDEHTGDFETLLRLEIALLMHNFSMFDGEKVVELINAVTAAAPGFIAQLVDVWTSAKAQIKEIRADE